MEPSKEELCWASMDGRTWRGCVCQLGTEPGEGGEVKGKEMRSNRNKKERTRMAQEAMSHEEEKAEMERKSMSDR